jgi:membrane protease YdiL (CAAX protease family)
MQSAPPSPDVTSASGPSARHIRLIVVAVAVGTTLTALTLRVPRGSVALYAAGFAQAGVWTAASVACRPIAWTGRWERLREVVTGVGVGLLSFVAFVGAAAVGRHIGFLAGPIDSVLRKADAGPVLFVLALALVNGVAEELFFRGLVIDVTMHFGSVSAVLISTALYVGVTAVGGNNALTAAALVMGTVFAIERVVSRGLLVPILTHLAWSTLMILALPR